MGMVIVTEELSRGSLGAAGSLITRPKSWPEPVGGWDGRAASAMAASDSFRPNAVCGFRYGTQHGVRCCFRAQSNKKPWRWHLNGGKTWCTYAGAAGALLVLRN